MVSLTAASSLRFSQGSCWEITKLSLLPFGNEAVHVDVLRPESKSHVMNRGQHLLNLFWLIFFGWWLCLAHISTGIVQCLSIIGIPTGLAHFNIAAIALWPVGRRVVPVEKGAGRTRNQCASSLLRLKMHDALPGWRRYLFNSSLRYLLRIFSRWLISTIAGPVAYAIC